MEQYIKVRDAAERLQVTPATVRRWLRQGKLPGRKFGWPWRVDWAAVQDRTKGAQGQR